VTTVTRETIDDRWLTLITGPDEHGREGTSEVYDRLTGAVAELAVRIVHGLWDSGHEDDSLIALTHRVEQLVEHEVKDFAMEVESLRRARIDTGRAFDAAQSRDSVVRRQSAPTHVKAQRGAPWPETN
jgi:hypothetical protein